MSAPASSPASPAASTAPAAPAPSKSFWPRSLIFADPNPTQLAGGCQAEAAAPMCPCSACWEHGSHALAPRRPRVAPAAAKAPSSKTTPSPKNRMSALHLLKKNNASKESVASDMRPLRQSVTLDSPARSVYGADQ